MPGKTSTRVALLATLALVLTSPGLAAASTAPALLVDTNSGQVNGELVQNGTVRRWLGIPYAEPPVGPLRWKATRPHRGWREPLQAHSYGSACSQVGWYYGPPPAGKAWGSSNVETFHQPVGSEDCLTLNVWRPNNDEAKLPVLFFIHGGANVVGHASDPIYEGAKLSATTHAVVVTINYRLGIFGRLSHPALRTGEPLSDSANFGILDIIEALRFVQANAAAFGGDPGAVTVMGESAGGGNIYALMGSPLANGLFHRAIVMSALYGTGYKQEEGAEFTLKLAAQALVADGQAPDAEAAAKLIGERGDRWLQTYLRDKPASELLAAQSQDRKLWNVPGFFADGVVLPPNLAEAFEQGKVHSVPTILGMTRVESKLLFNFGMKMSDSELFQAMLGSDPDAPPTLTLDAVLKPWLLPSLGATPFNLIHEAMTFYLRHKIGKNIAALERHFPGLYLYRFDWNQSPEPWRTLYGTSHGSDLPFMFGNFANNLFSMEYSAQNRAGREALSAAMMSSVGAFIRSDDPNTEALGLRWNAWPSKSEGHTRLIFDASDDGVRISTQR